MTTNQDAIDAAAAALSTYHSEAHARRLALVALTAAAPILAAQAKADALEQLAVSFEVTASCASYIGTEDIMETWLNAAQRARAAGIEAGNV